MPSPLLRLDTRVVQTQTIPTGEIDDELMALDANRGEVLGLDEIGTSIWKQANEPIAVLTILEWVVGEYEVDEETARRDVLPFLEQLVEARLLDIVK